MKRMILLMKCFRFSYSPREYKISYIYMVIQLLESFLQDLSFQKTKQFESGTKQTTSFSRIRIKAKIK